MALVACVLAGCESGAACALEDAGANDAPDAACASRLVVGPVLITEGLTTTPGAGFGCSSFGGVDLRVRVFLFGRGLFSGSPALVVERSVRCMPGSDYVDLGELPAGRYEIAVDVPGTALVAGSELVFAPCAPDTTRYSFCAGAFVELPACDLRVVPVALACSDLSMAGCEVP